MIDWNLLCRGRERNGRIVVKLDKFFRKLMYSEFWYETLCAVKNRKTPLPLVFLFLSCLCKFSEILSDARLRKFYINLRSQWDYVHINLDCVAFTMNYWVCKLLWIIFRNCPNFLVWNFCANTQFPQSFGPLVATPQNFRTR